MQRGPARAVLLRAVDVRREVAVAVRVEGDVRGAGRLRGRGHAADVGAVREAGRAARDLVPAAATVPRHLHVAVVGAHPQHRRVEGGFGERDDLAVRGGAVVARQRDVRAANAHDLERVAVAPPGEVLGAGEAVPPVARDEEAVAAEVDHVGVVARDQAGRHPVPAIGLLALGRREAQAHHVAGDVVEPGPPPVLRVDVDGAPVRVGLLVHPVPEAALPPLVVHDPVPGARRRRPHPRVVVLHPPVDPVRVAVVDGDPVELPDRQVVDPPEGDAHVVGLVQSGVPGEVEVLGIGGVDPHGVMVGVHAHVVGGALRDLCEGAAPVLAPVRGGGQRVDAILVRRVDEDVRVVHGADVLVADLAPAVAAVLAAVSAGLGRVLDQRVQDARVGPRDGDPDAALVARGEPLGEFVPAVAPVGRPVDAASRAAAVEAPGAPLALVHCRVENLRIRRVDDEVDRAGVLVDVEDPLPAAAPVARAIDAPVGRGAPQVAERRHVHDVRVGRMDLHATRVARLLQAEVPPGGAGVVGAVDAVAPRGALAVLLLPGPRVEDVRVGGRDGQVAEGADRHVLPQVRPGDAPVSALPEAARGRRHVDRGGVAGESLHVVDAAAGDGGADVARGEGGQLFGGDGLLAVESGGRPGQGGGGQERGEGERRRGARVGVPQGAGRRIGAGRRVAGDHCRGSSWLDVLAWVRSAAGGHRPLLAASAPRAASTTSRGMSSAPTIHSR